MFKRLSQKEIMQLIIFIFTCFVSRRIEGYSSGAPSTSCGDMLPSHNAPPKVTLPPYNLTVSTNTYKLGDVITSKCSMLHYLDEDSELYYLTLCKRFWFEPS